LDDDAIVVDGRDFVVIDVVSYLNTPETMRRQELEFGLVREPPSALFGHQSVLFRLAVAMDAHVRPDNLGTVIVSPMDVVLDRERSLVLQPDIIFISRRRDRIIRGQIWGAPDLVVEVLSPGTADRDRNAKVRWYRQYGVREYWLVDGDAQTLDVLTFAPNRTRRRRADRSHALRSLVLPKFRLELDTVFG
jgi:Uma2 family endonuclease